MKNETIVGKLSGKKIFIPDVNVPSMPSIAPPGPIYNGKNTEVLSTEELSNGHPDSCSYRRQFGLLVPATNTIMEHELWDILIRAVAGTSDSCADGSYQARRVPR